MKKEVKEVLVNEMQELSERYSKKEIVLEMMLEKYIEAGYDKKNFINDIVEFYEM